MFGIISFLCFVQYSKFKIKITHDIAGAGFIPLLKQGARDTPTQLASMSGVSFILLLYNGHQSCSGKFVIFRFKSCKVDQVQGVSDSKSWRDFIFC
jgi:hypothetical protein